MATARLCVTVTGRTMAELRRRRDEVTDADLVELRVDTVADPSAAGALEGRRLPVIFTCRARWEGGAFRGADEERHRLLRDAQALGADYIDVEWKSAFADLLTMRDGRGVVMSMHDFSGVPRDLAERTRAMRATGAEVVKVAVMAERLTDCAALLPLARQTTAPTVLIAMGDAGLASRVLAAKFNSPWTYAGDGAAPGQLPPTRVQREFAFRRVTPTTALYGVVGRPVMHSLSPAMHNAAFTAAGIDAVYLPFAATDYDDFLAFADAMGIAGASVTAPFKLDALARAVECDAVSRRIGAANTLRRHDGLWAARNTDVAGFLAPIHARGLDLTAKRATLLGAGGAARAVGDALVASGARVAVAARRRDRAAAVAAAIGAEVAAWPPRHGSWDVLVNTTPAGTAPAIDDTPLPDGPFDGSLVYDLVYSPPETRLLRDARRAGCATIGGLEMLVAQAEHQFTWWTGQAPSAGVMRQAALDALRRRDTLHTAGSVK